MMRQYVVAAVLLGACLSGCSRSDADRKRERERSLSEYVDSAKGKADLAKSRADAARKFGRNIQNTTISMWRLVEGTWTAMLPGGRRLEIGVSRDGGGGIEMLDVDGRSKAHAAVAVSLIRDGVRGVTTNPPKDLAPWARWTLTHDAHGTKLRTEGGRAIPVVRK